MEIFRERNVLRDHQLPFADIIHLSPFAVGLGGQLLKIRKGFKGCMSQIIFSHRHQIIPSAGRYRSLFNNRDSLFGSLGGIVIGEGAVLPLLEHANVLRLAQSLFLHRADPLFRDQKFTQVLLLRFGFLRLLRLGFLRLCDRRLRGRRLGHHGFRDDRLRLRGFRGLRSFRNLGGFRNLSGFRNFRGFRGRRLRHRFGFPNAFLCKGLQGKYREHHRRA